MNVAEERAETDQVAGALQHRGIAAETGPAEIEAGVRAEMLKKKLIKMVVRVKVKEAAGKKYYMDFNFVEISPGYMAE